jgi:hypothetical protein
MQEAVSEQETHLRQEASAAGTGLPKGRFERDDDVAEDAWRTFHRLFVHREREHVGGAVHAAMPLVQNLDGSVVDEQDAELGFFEAERPEHARR